MLRVYDNSADDPRLIASGARAETLTINDADSWHRIRAEAGYEGQHQAAERCLHTGDSALRGAAGQLLAELV